MARIVFMGTPEFAVPSLQALTVSPHEIVGVYTRPDQPAGRGKQLQASPIKQFATGHNLRVFQPTTFKDPAAAGELRALSPDIAIVAAYGLILPSVVLSIPPHRFVNTHASLLPRHRGAAPVAAAILAGDQETGVTLMQIEPGLDSGPIYVQRSIPIDLDDTTGTLTLKLAQLAAEMLTEFLDPILAGQIVPQPQDSSRASMFKTIQKQEGQIDWNQPAGEIARRVRAFSPWPSTITVWKGLPLKILKAHPIASHTSGEPGQVVQADNGIGVITGEGVLALDFVQLAGKRAMNVDEFLRGQRDFLGARLG